MPKTSDRRQAKRTKSVPQSKLRPPSRAEAAAEAPAPVVGPAWDTKTADLGHLKSDAMRLLDTALPKQPEPTPGSALLELADGTRISHPNRGDGRRIILNGAVFDIAGTLDGVPVFRFVMQEPLPG